MAREERGMRLLPCSYNQYLTKVAFAIAYMHLNQICYTVFYFYFKCVHTMGHASVAVTLCHTQQPIRALLATVFDAFTSVPENRQWRFLTCSKVYHDVTGHISMFSKGSIPSWSHFIAMLC